MQRSTMDNMTLVRSTTTTTSLEILANNLDNLFLVVMGSFVLLMQAGFAFLEAGSVRAKNATNILFKNLADLCFGVLSFWLLGYGLAFGQDVGLGIMGSSAFATSEASRHAHFFFQSTFAATSATIVSGAIAERCHFDGYIVFSSIMTACLYPLPAHWAWHEQGWLRMRGFSDFAGSGVVHMAGGVSALIGCLVVGPRCGRFTSASSPLRGHSTPQVSLGCFLLCLGFVAFNGGSRGSISRADDGVTVATAVVSTLLSCATAGIVVVIAHRHLEAHWSLAKNVNGCLAGMVAVSGGCDAYSPATSLFIGMIAGLFYLASSRLIEKMNIDDPVDAIAVHFVSGALGLLINPLLRADGVLMSHFSSASLAMLTVNTLGLLIMLVYHGTLSFLLFKTLHKLNLLRVDAKSELLGLDLVKHKDQAYNFESLWSTNEGDDVHGEGDCSHQKHKEGD